MIGRIRQRANEGPREFGSNAGLWLDKFIRSHNRDDKESRRTLVTQVAAIKEPPEYDDAFARWKAALEGLGASYREAKAHGRLAVGLGGEGGLEAGITLYRTYGVPYIPGSALKGLAAKFANDHLGDGWAIGSPAYNAIFGTTTAAGYITFFDAWYIPGSGHDKQPIHADVLTVHHQNYYRNSPDAAPADWDDPNPVPFLSATGSYLVALAAPGSCEHWVPTVFDIIGAALRHSGIGAKTSSGYGRLVLGRPPVDPDKQKADELISSIVAIPLQRVPGEVPQRAQEWRGLNIGPMQKRRVAEAIVAKLREAGREKAVAQKDWYKEVVSSLQNG